MRSIWSQSLALFENGTPPPDRTIGTAFQRRLKLSLDVWPQLPVRSRDQSGLLISGTFSGVLRKWRRKRPNARQGEGYST